MNNALEQALDFGATYAEIRLMAETTSSVRLKDGQLEHAIPGQEIGATLRILADGAWGVHSTTDISNIPNEIESTVKLARAVAARRPSGSKPIGLILSVLGDEIAVRTGNDTLSTLFGMEKFDDIKDILKLIELADHQTYPAPILNLGLQMRMARRGLRCYRHCPGQVQPNHGIIAGCTQSTSLANIYLKVVL